MISKRVREMMETGTTYPLAEYSEEEGDLIKLCSNENPLGPSPKALKAVKEEAERIGEYPESASVELKEAIGDYIDVNPVEICVGNGSDEVLDLICKAFMDSGDKALVPIPTFSQYELVCRINSVEPKFLELEKFQWKAGKLIENMNDVKAAFIGRPNNPTGNGLDEKGLEELLETGKAIIVDEAYVEFEGDSVVSWVKNYDNLVVLRTFSKIFGLAGLRVGYGIANPELVMALETVRPPFSVNRLAQKAAFAALKDKDFLQESKEMILKGREYLARELENLGFKVLPSNANFLMVSPEPIELTATKLYDYLSENGIVIRNLSGFRGIEGEWIRITVGKPDQNKYLIKTLKELKEKGE